MIGFLMILTSTSPVSSFTGETICSSSKPNNTSQGNKKSISNLSVEVGLSTGQGIFTGKGIASKL